MRRYRWLKATWPITMRVLANRLNARAFDGERSEGFVVDRVRGDYLEAKFVEKIEYDENVTDPFGVESSFHRIEYRKCEFKASVAGPGLELIDPPRSIQAMISRLAEAAEFSLSISPVSVDVLAWATGIQRSMNVSGEVDSVQVGEIELAKGARAKAIVRGASDVLDAASKLVAGKKHVIEKVQLRLAGAKPVTVLLTNVGLARFEHDPSDEFLLAVRASLPISSHRTKESSSR